MNLLQEWRGRNDVVLFATKKLVDKTNCYVEQIEF